MNKICSNNRIIAFAFVTLFSLTQITAQGICPAQPSPIEFKYIGMIKNNPVFQLNFNSLADNDGIAITVKDEYGATLYSENIIGRYLSKKFMLNSDEIGDTILRFEIMSKNTGIVTWFEVNSSNQFIQNWVIRTNSGAKEL